MTMESGHWSIQQALKLLLILKNAGRKSVKGPLPVIKNH